MSSIEYINSVVLTASAANVTFSNIPQYYQDLNLVINSTATNTTPQNILTRFNNDSSASYSYTTLWGNGSTVGSNRSSNIQSFYLDYYGGVVNSSFSVHTLDILSYSNTNIFKTSISTGSLASGGTDCNVSLYRSLSAINQIFLFNGGGNFNTGSTFTLWGVR